MNEKYLTLFREIVHSTELLAERVVDYNKKKEDTKGAETAETFRNDYAALFDKLRQEGLDPDTITRAEWIRILVGTMIVANNLNEQINASQKALQGYKIDLIPKLNRIIDETKTDEEAKNLANELFQIKENSNN